MDHLDGYLATAALDSDIPLSIKAALAVGKKTLNRYYDKTDHSEVFRIAMGPFSSLLVCIISHRGSNLVLHPQHKLEYFQHAGWEQEWIDRAVAIVRAEFERSYKYAEHLQPVSQPTEVRWYLYLTRYLNLTNLTANSIKGFFGASKYL